MRVSTTETIIDALWILSRDIESNDGVANAAIGEAAVRLQETYDLMDSAYAVIEEWKPSAPAKRRWKTRWLKAARAAGATGEF